MRRAASSLHGMGGKESQKVTLPQSIHAEIRLDACFCCTLYRRSRLWADVGPHPAIMIRSPRDMVTFQMYGRSVRR